MPFKIDTQIKGIYIISEDSIAHHFFSIDEVSPGLLVKKHYTEIEQALYAAWFLREGKCYESIAAYFHSDDDLKDAPHLEKVAAAIEKQMDLLTDGGYQKYVDAHEKQDWKLMEGNRYWREIQDIWAEIDTLKEKRYYENEIHHHPGIPRIETVGKRLVDQIMDLVWRMDNDAPGKQEELVDAFYRVNEKMENRDRS